MTISKKGFFEDRKLKRICMMLGVLCFIFIGASCQSATNIDEVISIRLEIISAGAVSSDEISSWYSTVFPDGRVIIERGTHNDGVV